MKKTLLLLAILSLSLSSLNAQGKKKQVAEPIDNSYQVVNVTNEASICFDTLTKRFDMVCYVSQNGAEKTVQVILGTDFHEIMNNLKASMIKYNVKRRTVDYVIKYFVLYREMPFDDWSLSLDYCSDYALKLNLASSDYDIANIPITFAIADPNAKEKLKQRVTLSTGQFLAAEHIQKIKDLITNEVVKTDAETDFFLKITTPKVVVEEPQPVVEQQETAETKENGKADKKTKKDKKEKKDKKK